MWSLSRVRLVSNGFKMCVPFAIKDISVGVAIGSALGDMPGSPVGRAVTTGEPLGEAVVIGAVVGKAVPPGCGVAVGARLGSARSVVGNSVCKVFGETVVDSMGIVVGRMVGVRVDGGALGKSRGPAFGVSVGGAGASVGSDVATTGEINRGVGGIVGDSALLGLFVGNIVMGEAVDCSSCTTATVKPTSDPTTGLAEP